LSGKNVLAKQEILALALTVPSGQSVRKIIPEMEGTSTGGLKARKGKINGTVCVELMARESQLILLETPGLLTNKAKSSMLKSQLVKATKKPHSRRKLESKPLISVLELRAQSGPLDTLRIPMVSLSTNSLLLPTLGKSSLDLPFASLWTDTECPG